MTLATFHTDLPNKPQERPFAETLQRLDFPPTRVPQLWFRPIQGIPDTDTILLCPGIGLFVIELKSWSLSCLLGVGANGLRVDPQCKTSSKQPWGQAQDACDALKKQMERRNYWDERSKPWFSAGVALYRISRNAFMERFSGGVNTHELESIKYLSEGLIFAEDLDDGETFVRRLDIIKYHPILRSAPANHDGLRYDAKMVGALNEYQNWKSPATRSLSAYDHRRIKIIEKSEEKSLELIDPTWPVICSGYAGTGKTVLGLHAILLRSTPSLFLCFNKVLAADIRRITSLSSKFQRFPFEAHDVWEFLAVCERQLGVSGSARNSLDFDEWAGLRLEQVFDADGRQGGVLKRQWGCVVVDEAQDLPDWSWKLINRLAAGDTLLFVAESKGQALYRSEPAEEFAKLVGAGPLENSIKKRRVFRTTDANFLLSQLFLEAYPSKQEASRVWEKQLGPQYRKAFDRKMPARGQREKNNQADFELSRRGGRPPKVRNLWQEVQSAPVGANLTEVGVQMVADLLSAAYQEVIKHEGNAGDILILVPYNTMHPNERADRPDWLRIAKEACTSISLQFIDYTDEEQKREIAIPQKSL